MPLYVVCSDGKRFAHFISSVAAELLWLHMCRCQPRWLISNAELKGLTVKESALISGLVHLKMDKVHVDCPD